MDFLNIEVFKLLVSARVWDLWVLGVGLARGASVPVAATCSTHGCGSRWLRVALWVLFNNNSSTNLTPQLDAQRQREASPRMSSSSCQRSGSARPRPPAHQAGKPPSIICSLRKCLGVVDAGGPHVCFLRDGAHDTVPLRHDLNGLSASHAYMAFAWSTTEMPAVRRDRNLPSSWCVVVTPTAASFSTAASPMPGTLSRSGITGLWTKVAKLSTLMVAVDLRGSNPRAAAAAAAMLVLVT